MKVWSSEREAIAVKTDNGEKSVQSRETSENIQERFSAEILIAAKN